MVESPVFGLVVDCPFSLLLEHLCHRDQVLNIQALAGVKEDCPLTGVTLAEVAQLLQGKVLAFDRKAEIKLNLGRSLLEGIV